MKKTLLSRLVPALSRNISTRAFTDKTSKFKKYNHDLKGFIIKASLYDGPSGKILGK
ncbi:hypothetical protein [Proteus phage PM2]|uniref:Uncharacterized protein n=1 Tax=Proteus phage PM2 TaxID=2025809 RepID=A0A249XWJ8_9CAUD|nr:hypothetical protein KNT71_gp016 [Proteus phage PM2]ASZ76302.1 hypothetical protein [Proteus phage PM2]